MAGISLGEGRLPGVSALVSGALAGQDRTPGDLELRVTLAAGEVFDRVPVAIPRGEVHRAEITLCSESRIDETDVLEELRSIDGGHEAHAGDYVPDGHGGRALPLMLLPDDLIGGRSLGCQTLFQPAERRSHHRILIV